jgi:peptidoglycan/LPS O-acetylase OafA/YrhL
VTDTRITVPRPAGRSAHRAPSRRAAAPARATHRRDIEGLRAVAVLLVVLYHCGVPLIGGGYVGVDVFFVISGFLITSLLLREATATGRVSIAGFYARRFLRLLPAAAVVTAVTMGAAIRWLPPLRSPQIALDALFATLYGVNYRLAATGIDYLNADAAPSPLQHFWSLAVEEQFYLVWPLLLLGAYALGRRRGVAVALTAVVLLSFAVSVWQTGANGTWAYFGLHTRAWELGVGALVAVLGLRLPRRAATVLSGAGLVAIVLAALVYTARTPFPGYAALLPVAGAAAVLIGGTSAPSGLLSESLLQVIGRWSYSWYLWHWPFLMIGPYALGVAPGRTVNLLLAGGALVAAAVTYALVENPVRHWTALRSRTWLTIGCALAVTVTTAAGYAVVGASDPGAAALRTDYVAPVITVGSADLPRLLADGVRTPEVPANLTPPLARGATDDSTVAADGCAGDVTDAEVKRPCAYGDLRGAETVVLFGDSHARHWFPAFEQVARQRGWRLVIVTKSACSAASVRIFQDKLNRPFNECVRWREAVWDYIAELRPSRVVMTSAVAGGTVVDDSGARILDPGYADRTWLDGWTRSARKLAATGARVYLIEDTPYQQGDPIECLSTHLRDPRACVVSWADAPRFPERRRAIRATLSAEGVRIINPLPWFCTPQACPVIVGNLLVYRDNNHITATYMRTLAPVLSPMLD